MENNEMIENFITLWTYALQNKKGFKGLIDYNVIVDNSNTEIKASDFNIDYEKLVVYLYYKGFEIAMINLNSIKYIY